MRDGAPLLVVPADVTDRSLEDVPGRGAHGFRIPVLPEFLTGGNVQLRVWEAKGPLYRGRLFVAEGNVPRLRRVRDDGSQPGGEGSAPAAGSEPKSKRWWGR
jgi:hypothetical protein